MKNLKKVSREQLKQIKGGAIGGICAPGYYLQCLSVGQCDEAQDLFECSCHCVPKL